MTNAVPFTSFFYWKTFTQKNRTIEIHKLWPLGPFCTRLNLKSLRPMIAQVERHCLTHDTDFVLRSDWAERINPRLLPITVLEDMDRKIFRMKSFWNTKIFCQLFSFLICYSCDYILLFCFQSLKISNQLFKISWDYVFNAHDFIQTPAGARHVTEQVKRKCAASWYLGWTLSGPKRIDITASVLERKLCSSPCGVARVTHHDLFCSLGHAATFAVNIALVASHWQHRAAV